MRKVSIIVPIYNVEKYLRRCVESLLAQTLEDIEIILVNDASPDNSCAIMEQYEKQFASKIKCIYLKKNLRLGGARNIGIEVASGEYVAFVDSDDMIDPFMCEKMYEKAKMHNSDIVYCDYSLFWDEASKNKNKMMVHDAQMGEVTTEKLRSLLFEEHYAWAKLIRRSLIMEHRIFFPENRMYEDIPTTRFFLFYAKRIDKVNQCLYYYYQRPDSITHSQNASFQYDEADMAMLLYERCKERGMIDTYMNEVKMLFALLFYIYPLNNCLEKFTEAPIEYMKFLKKKIQQIYPDYMNNSYINKVVEPRLLLQAKANDVSPEYLVELRKKNMLSDKTISYLPYYRECKDKIEALYYYCKDRNWKIAIWGAGKKGTDFITYCKEIEIYYDAVIDKNECIRGKLIDHYYTVQSYDEIYSNIDIVYVINKNYLYDIQREIHEKNHKTITLNLDGYLCFDISIETWVSGS